MKNKILAFVAIAFLTGCSGPSTNDAQNTLSQYLESQSGGQIKLASFNKTDGQKTEVMGVQCYNLSYEADITFTSDGFWLAHANGQAATFGFSKTGVAFGGMNGQTQVHSGDRVKIGGVMVGQKSEKGWTFDVGDCHIISGPTAGTPVSSSSNANGSSKERTKVMLALMSICQAKMSWMQAMNTKSIGSTTGGPKVSAVPTEDDLRPFFPDKKFPIHPSGGRFVINALKDLPESTTYGVLQPLHGDGSPLNQADADSWKSLQDNLINSQRSMFGE